jgi:hypothetical protein
MSFNQRDFLQWAQNQQNVGGPGFDTRNSRERLEREQQTKPNNNDTSDKTNDRSDSKQ